MEEIEKIDNYLSGKLSTEARLQYENELAQKQELRDLQEKVIVAKEIIVSANIRKTVSEVHQKFINERPISSNSQTERVRKPQGKQVFLSSFVRVAASFVLLLAGFAIYQYVSISPQSILADATVEYNPSMFRGSNSNLQTIRTFYKAKDYTAVINEIGKEQKLDSEMLFLRAMSNFSLKNYQESLKDFGAIKQQNASSLKPSYVYEIEYYESLAMIGTEQYAMALEKLEALKANNQNPYSKLISDWDLFKLKILESK